MNTIETMSFGQLASIAVAAALVLAMVCVHYVDWTIKRDARNSPNDPELQAAAALSARRSFLGDWLSVAVHSAFLGVVLGILALGFGSVDVVQFAGVLFFLGAGASIASRFAAKQIARKIDDDKYGSNWLNAARQHVAERTVFSRCLRGCHWRYLDSHGVRHRDSGACCRNVAGRPTERSGDALYCAGRCLDVPWFRRVV
jgi:hypothetical protein